MSGGNGPGGSPLGAAVARVRGPDGRPVGGAFLAAPGHLLTVAHVVNDALGRPQAAAERPDAGARVQVDFPLLAAGRVIEAEVVHWVPPVLTADAAVPEDVAALRLLGPVPDGASPVSLLDGGDRMDLRAVVLGFPALSDAGVWSVGRLRGRQAGGWVQIDIDRTSQFALQPGFSGVPVWDVDAAAPVGMVVAAWRGGQIRSGYLIPASGLYAAWPALRGLSRPPSPFPGLRPFTERESAAFFGRGQLVGRIVRLAATAPVVTVVGPSGVGKSSLIHAGVLPAVRRGADTVVVVTRPSQARTPLRALALALDRAVAPDRDPVERVDRVTELTRALRGGAVREIAGDLLRSRGARRLLIVVDQWEEAFAGPAADSGADADDLGRVLAEALRPDSPLHVLTALRADFLGAALRRPATRELVSDTWNVTVGELDSEELREVVVSPVERIASVRYEDGLVERLLAEVGDAPGRLPLVQFALAELWQAQANGLMTHQAYDALGGVRRALANHADAVWTGLGDEDRRHAARLLVQLVRPIPESSGFTRRLATRTDFDDSAWAAAGRLATARLVVLREPERTDGAATPVLGAELAHDTLLTHWERLRRLAEAERDFRLWQEDLRRRLDRWRAEGRPRRRLLSWAELRDARRWERDHADQLGAAEVEFITAGRRWRRRLLQRSAATAIAVVLVAGVLWFRQAHTLSATAADSLAAQASSESYDAYLQAQFALRAYRTRHTDLTADTISNVGQSVWPADRLLADRQTAFRKPPEPPDFDQVSTSNADGTVLVTADQTLRPGVWRIHGGQVTAQRLTDADDPGASTSAATIDPAAHYAAFVQDVGTDMLPGARTTRCSPHGKTIALTTCLTVYDLRTGRPVVHIPATGVGRTTGIRAFSVDPDDRVLAAAFQDSSGGYAVRRWDLRTGHLLGEARLPGTVGGVPGLWLAPGGGSAAVFEETGSIGAQRLHALTRLTFGAHGATARALATGIHDGGAAVSGDGTTVAATVPAAGGHPAELCAWDIRTAARTSCATGLPDQPAEGHLTLDGSGRHAYLAWAPSARTPPTGSPDAPDASVDRALADAFTVHVARWTAGASSIHDTGLRLYPAWTFVRPTSSAVVLLTDGAVGLVLPHHGEPSPLARLKPPLSRWPEPTPDAVAGQLCAALPDRELTTVDDRAVPQGAFRGDPCS